MQPSLTSERLIAIEMVMVAARDHPLAAIPGPIPRPELARHIQLIIAGRSSLSAGREFGVMSPLVWRLGDLFAKRAFLLDRLGWGGMLLHTVAGDIARGRLVVLPVEDTPAGGLILPMATIYRTAKTVAGQGRLIGFHRLHR